MGKMVADSEVDVSYSYPTRLFLESTNVDCLSLESPSLFFF